MKIYKTSKGILMEQTEKYYLLQADWDTFINDDNLYEKATKRIANLASIQNAAVLLEKHLQVPMQSQELWASGVTYYNSKLGRELESKEAGGSSFYARVYEADRPELFFKASLHRTVPSGGEVRIRQDSTWDVPEPELTLMISTNGKIIGYTVGNDMSSRSIEGENPLYLPQAKTYDACAGLGPCILVTPKPISMETLISMKILRNNQLVFEDQIAINNIKRKLPELAEYLFRECSFPYGALLMTGTGIVPANDFTLQARDEIQIHISGIGTLINYVK